ncbi:hypothetical protein R84B8_02317 [Treponema sp. R8-4-B8]
MKEVIINMEKILKRTTVIMGIIIFALVFSTCKEGLENLQERTTPPAGMVNVTINIVNNNERTVWPRVNIEDITSIKISIYDYIDEKIGTFIGESSPAFNINMPITVYVSVPLGGGLYIFCGGL